MCTIVVAVLRVVRPAHVARVFQAIRAIHVVRAIQSTVSGALSVGVLCRHIFSVQ